MIITKKLLEKLYKNMSIGDMAVHLNIPKSTLYYHMEKFDICRRSKSEAQSKHLSGEQHQRIGKTHSEETRNKISEGTKSFWDSADGKKQKKKLGHLRKEEWDTSSSKEKSSLISKLQSAKRPKAGELSRFGKKLFSFLSEYEDVDKCIKLTSSHISDIILPTHKIVIELLLPIDIYGHVPKQRIKERYDRLAIELQDLGYRLMIIEDHSNSISTARCQRIYNQLLEFSDNKQLSRVIIYS